MDTEPTKPVEQPTEISYESQVRRDALMLVALGAILHRVVEFDGQPKDEELHILTQISGYLNGQLEDDDDEDEDEDEVESDVETLNMEIHQLQLQVARLETSLAQERLATERERERTREAEKRWWK